MSFRKLIESFIRTDACREKCGDDGKNDIIPSTDFEKIDDINVVYRECGCPLKLCPRRKNRSNPCITLEYFFVDTFNKWSVCCKSCNDLWIRNHEGRRDSVIFYTNCLPADEPLPTDLSPRIVFREMFDRGNYMHGSYRFNNPDCWLCSRCDASLYYYVYDCHHCDDTLPCVPEVDDDELMIEIDELDRLRRLDNVTPIDQMIKNPYHRHISDSELDCILDDYYDDGYLTPDNSDYNCEPTDEYMQYNGYF